MCLWSGENGAMVSAICTIFLNYIKTDENSNFVVQYVN